MAKPSNEQIARPTGELAADGLTAKDSSGRTLLVFAAIAAVALTLRLAHLYQASSLPFFTSPISDARIYLEWSRKIVAGEWFGREVFYQAPLYPYFLAVTQLLVGQELWRIHLAQMVLGSFACGFLFLAGRRFFSQRVGLLAGVLLACWPTAIFFDGLIQKTVLDTFFICLLLWLLATISRRVTTGALVLAGIALGCFALTRENVIIFFPIIALWLLLHPASQLMVRRVTALALFALGTALVLVPVGLRNRSIGGKFLITTAQMGPNFFIGNNENANGTYAPLLTGRDDPVFERTDATELAEQATGRTLMPGEVSDYWFSRATSWIGSHPAEWLRLMGRKCMLLVNAYELPDAEDIYDYEAKCRLIRGLGVVGHFGVVAPLAVAGMILTWSRRRELWFIHALLAALGLGVVMFFVLARYRFPMVPILILFAAAGLVECVSRLRRGNWRSVGITFASAGLAAIPINWPVTAQLSHAAWQHMNTGAALFQEGKNDAAIEEFQAALQIEPSNSTAHVNIAGAYWRAGRLPEAIQSYRRALELRPDDLEIALNLGNVLSDHGELVEAEKHLRAALAIAHRRPEVFNNLGVLMVRQGKWGEAIEMLRRGAREAPEELNILANLAWNLATCPSAEYRNGAEAVQLAETCCKKTSFKDPRGLDILAAAYAETGRFADAVASEERAMKLAAKGGIKGAEDFEARLQLYKTNSPYRRPAQSGG